jgi:serine/threonine protein kinase
MGKVSPLTDAESLVGITLSGGYKTDRLIDEAGSGIVLAARDQAGHAVAVKVLRPQAATEEMLSRVSREASILTKLNDRHVVPVLDVGHDLESDLVYLVMPLLSGSDVADVLGRAGVLPPVTAARIALQASNALIAAHAAGIAFRDLRPAKLFLENTAEGEVVVRVLGPGLREIDADSPTGLGSTTTGSRGSGSGSGASARADRRADIFCLGAVLYQMLSGRPPFAEDRPSNPGGRGPSSRRIPPIQDVAPWIEAPLALALHGAITGDLHRRYASAEAFHEMLRAVTGSEESLTVEMLTPLEQVARAYVAERADFDADPLVGHSLGGRYKVLRLIGRGGMGGVYETEAADGRRLAAKVIFRSVAGQDDQHMRRFIREARAATAIDSPHVVRTFELGTDLKLGSPFIAMELLDGIDVARLLQDKGPMRPPEVVRIFVQAARGLSAAHEAGIVHRDVKPANLFLHTPEEGGKVLVKVCDFGVAKRTEEGMTHDLTREGGVLGSPLYMSPEQAKTASHVDHRSDIWGLCVSLYQTLCGAPPWSPNASLAELLLAICTERVPPLGEAAPWLSPALCAAVHKGLARDPDERWQSMDAFIAALGPHTGGTVDFRLADLVSVSAAELARARGMDSLRAATGRARPSRARQGSASSSTIDRDVVVPARLTPRGRGGLFVGAGAAALVLATVLLVRPPPPAGGLVTSGALGPAPAVQLRASVMVPDDALVDVNGVPAKVDAGRVELVGEAGDAFELVVRVGDVHRMVRVILTKDGRPEPERIDLPAPAATASATASASAAVRAPARPATTTTESGPGTGDLRPR